MTDSIDISIIFDIAQRVEAPTGPSDAEAINFHFEDVAVDQGRTAKMWSKSAVSLPKLQVPSPSDAPTAREDADQPTHSPNNPSYHVIGTVSARPTDMPTVPPTFTAILMTIVRLEQQATDIVVTINVPFDDPKVVETEKCIASPVYGGDDIDPDNGHKSELLGLGMNVSAEVIGSFRIVDWGLFVVEE